MVSSVTLGQFFTLSNGKTVLGGSGGSGLDTQALMNSLLDAKKVPLTKDQDQITKNGKIASALGKFQSLLSAFQSSADALRNPPGVGNAADNVFKFTTSSISNGGSSYFSVTSAAGASLQSYQISDISSVASAASQRSGTFNVNSADDSVVPPAGGGASFGIGSITFGTQTVDINSGDSLNSIAAKFNAVSSITGIGASVIAIDSTHYSLSFLATKTGTNANFDLSLATDSGGVLAGVGLTVPVSGNNAAFKLNGVDIIRQSNSINDVIKDVTFNINQTTPDAVTNYGVTISPDNATIQNVINNFVSNYNALKTFQAQQTQQKSDGTYADTALLANNQTFLSIMNNINAQVNSQLSGGGNGVSSLVDIGISFTNTPATDTDPEVDNTLTVNDGTLTSALQSKFADVQKLFGFTLTSDNANLTIFKHTNALTISSMTLNVDSGAHPPVYTATYSDGSGSHTVNLTATPLGNNVPGVTLAGPDGGPLEGLQLIYASDSAATIHVSLTQGIADKLYNTTSGALTTNTGSLAIEQQSIKTANDNLNTNIANINQQISVYQDQLLAKFAALEQAISKVNSLLTSLTANDTAYTNAAQG